MDKKQLLVFGIAGAVVYCAWVLFGKKKQPETAPDLGPRAVIDENKGAVNEGE